MNLDGLQVNHLYLHGAWIKSKYIKIHLFDEMQTIFSEFSVILLTLFAVYLIFIKIPRKEKKASPSPTRFVNANFLERQKYTVHLSQFKFCVDYVGEMLLFLPRDEKKKKKKARAVTSFGSAASNYKLLEYIPCVIENHNNSQSLEDP